MASHPPSSFTKKLNQPEDVKQNAHLYYNLRVLIYDLRHFSSHPPSQARLELIIDPSYIGAPYFTPSEAQLLKRSTNGDLGRALQSMIEETLATKLKRGKRVSSADYRPCAAHDLAPIFERWFDIKPKDLQRDKEFLKCVKKEDLMFHGGATGKESKSAGEEVQSKEQSKSTGKGRKEEESAKQAKKKAKRKGKTKRGDPQIQTYSSPGSDPKDLTG